MASIHPFRALRPEPAAAPAVSSVPYDIVTTEEARRLASGNPLSFLHVTRSEIDLSQDIDPYSPAVYAKARENFDTLRRTAPLMLEDEQALYFYRLRTASHEQTGIAGCFSVDEYESDIIKKHERTRRDKEDDRTRHMIELRAQTGLVFLAYKAVASLDSIAQRVIRENPLFDFTAQDGVHHTIWRASQPDTAAAVLAFASIPALYIADGHHRAASAARARAELYKQLRAGEADTFIAVAFPDNQVQILPYHRVIKDLAGHTPSEFLERLRKVADVTEGPAEPRRKGEVSIYLDKRWHVLDLSKTAPEDSSHGSSLDVALLQRNVLERILGIGDVRSDKRIDFVGGARGTKALEELVDSGQAAVAFSMYPVTVDDLIAISDAGGIMPPKSTWFEPKLRDGLLIHLI